MDGMPETDIQSPSDIYSRKLIRRLDRIISIKAVALVYAKDKDPEVSKTGRKHLKKIADQQLNLYYPLYFKQRLGELMSELSKNSQELITGYGEFNSIKSSLKFTMRYFLNRAYKRDIDYLTRSLKLVERISSTNLPSIVQSQYQIAKALESAADPDEINRLLAAYKWNLNKEKEEIHEIKHEVEELQEITEKEKNRVKKLLQWLLSQIRHEHSPEEQKKKVKVILEYLVKMCGVFIAMTVITTVIKNACAEGSAPKQVFEVAQGMFAFLDLIVDTGIVVTAGVLGVTELKQKLSELEAIRKLAQEKAAQVASL